MSDRLRFDRGDLPLSLWPPAHRGDTASVAAMALQLDATQWLTPAEIAAGQARQLAALVAHFARVSPPFRARLDAADIDPSHWKGDDFTRLTPIGRRDLQRDHPHAPPDPPPAGHGQWLMFQSSGSTGEPVRIWKSTAAQIHWTAMTLRYAAWAGGDYTRRLATIRADLDAFGEFPDWGMPVAAFHASGPRLAFPITTSPSALAAQLRAFAAEVLIAYPSTLAGLLDHLTRRGETLPALRQVRTIGETLSPRLRDAVATVLQASVYDCYSSQETGYIALQCPDNPAAYHVTAETLIVEVLDPDGRPCAPRELGRVVVTDLTNIGTPVIRYAIGDWAEAGAPCPCGRGLPTLARIAGRERNLVTLPDGTRHWPLTGYRRFRNIAPVVQYQLVQHEVTRIEARLVVDRTLTVDEETLLIALMKASIDPAIDFDLVYVPDRLPVGRNGKFEEFVSLLPS